MKIALQVKLLPTEEQATLLKDTIKIFNDACNAISQIAWEKHIFNQFKLHHEVYYNLRDIYGLSSQLAVRAIGKVANSYKVKRGKRRHFRSLKSITYDNRILSYKKDIVSISLLGGRIKIPFKCYRPELLSHASGEAYLLYKKGKFYLNQAVDIQEQEKYVPTEFIGVDMGVTDIIATSDGILISSSEVQRVRKKYIRTRANVQSKGTRSCYRLLKRLSGREKLFATVVNHTISKWLVQKAKDEGKGIAIENLKGIRKCSNRNGKRQKKKSWGNFWSFYQLRSFLEYKSTLQGVVLEVVNPAYTSKTCHECMHIGERHGKTFKCKHCGNVADADINAAKNIAAWGYVNTHEGWEGLSCSIYDNRTTSKACCKCA